MITSLLLTYLTSAIVLLTSIWAGVDAHRYQIPSGKKPYSRANAVSWLLCCLLLWIISFPVYLYNRAKTLKGRGEASGSSAAISWLGSLAVVVTMLCIAAPFLGWPRLSVDELRDQVSTSIQNTWNSKPATQNIRLKSLTLARRAGNEYDGQVVADVSGKEEKHNVAVTYDGKTFRWKIQ